MHRAQYTNLFLFHQIYIEESYGKLRVFNKKPYICENQQ